MGDEQGTRPGRVVTGAGRDEWALGKPITICYPGELGTEKLFTVVSLRENCGVAYVGEKEDARRISALPAMEEALRAVTRELGRRLDEEYTEYTGESAVAYIVEHGRLDLTGNGNAPGVDEYLAARRALALARGEVEG